MSDIPEQIDDLAAFESALTEFPAVFAYFGGDSCNVCKTLRPQVFAMLAERFPQIRLVYVDAEKAAEIAGQSQVFSIPTVVAWFDGRETLRKARHFSLGELESGLSRPYSLFFE